MPRKREVNACTCHVYCMLYMYAVHVHVHVHGVCLYKCIHRCHLFIVSLIVRPKLGEYTTARCHAVIVCVCVSINIHWWCSIYIVLIIPIYCVLITATSFDGSKCTSYQISNPFVRSKVVYT